MAIKTSTICIPAGPAEGDHGIWYGTSFFNSTHRYGDNNGNNLNTFCRFDNCMIPAGATITEALFRIRAAGSLTGANCHITIKVNDSDDAVAPTSYTEGGALTWVTPTIAWDPGSQDINSWYDTPDLKDLIQDVIDRVGWAEGNAIMIGLIDNSSDYNSYRDMGVGTTLHNHSYLKITFTHATEVRLQSGVAAADCQTDIPVTGVLDTTPTFVRIGSDASANEYNNLLRFQNCPLLTGSTISAATLYGFADESTSDNVDADIYGVDADDITLPTSDAEFDALPLTTATVHVDLSADITDLGFYTIATGLETIIAEIVGRAGYANGNDIGLVLQTSTAQSASVKQDYIASDGQQVANGASESANGPILAITFVDPVTTSPKIMMVL